MQSYKKAFSLIEAAIVLGIIGLVIGGIWVAASAVSDGLKMSKLKEQTLTLYHKAAPLFRGDFGYMNTNVTSTFSTGGLAPSEMITGSTLIDPWGKDVTIFVTSSSTQQRFGIQLNGHSVAECTYIVKRALSTLKLQNCAGSNANVGFPNSGNTILSGNGLFVSTTIASAVASMGCTASNGVFGLDIPMCQ